MQKQKHPKYSQKVTVTCTSCTNTFTTGSTSDDISVEICYNCHPFYTGKAKIVDTENLVQKFEDRSKKQDTKHLKRKKTKRARRASRTQEIKAGKQVTLKDMLKELS